MSLKNYYTILGVPQAADEDQIKTAFRALAKKYHPDKAPENPFAQAHFTQIQEAYEVLSRPAKRAKYDEERWLRGLSQRSNATVRLTPEWVLAEALRLKTHMSTVDTYHMNHMALRDYVMALLNDEHLSVLQEGKGIREQIAAAIFDSIQKLRFQYTAEVAGRLLLLAGNDETFQQSVLKWQKARQKEYQSELYRPLIVLLFAALIALIIWWLN